MKRLFVCILAIAGIALQSMAQTFCGKSYDEVFVKAKKAVEVNVSTANLRTGPDKSSEVGDQVMRGTLLFVLDETDEWYKVIPQFSGSDILYVSKSLCKAANVGTIPSDAEYHYDSRYKGGVDFVHVKGIKDLVVMHTSSEMGGEQINLGCYANGMFTFCYNTMLPDDVGDWEKLSLADYEKIFRERVNEGMNFLSVVTASSIKKEREEQ